ncbi:uncharacterized protein LOC106997446 [Macaca mulatta]
MKPRTPAVSVTVLKDGVSRVGSFRHSDVSGASSFWWVRGLADRSEAVDLHESWNFSSEPLTTFNNLVYSYEQNLEHICFSLPDFSSIWEPFVKEGIFLVKVLCSLSTREWNSKIARSEDI